MSVALEYEREWKAGEMGCGDLLLILRKEVQQVGPGKILLLEALDPGAREDIPSWCRITGHTLLAAEHPHYWIQRKLEE